MSFDPRRLVLDDLDERDPVVDPPPPSKIKIKIKSGNSYVLPPMTISQSPRTHPLTLPSQNMASGTVASSSKANAAPGATATLTTKPAPATAHSKRRLPSYGAQVYHEAHQSKKPRLEEAIYSSAKDGIEAAIKSAYDKVHADEVNRLKTQLQKSDDDVKLYKGLFHSKMREKIAQSNACIDLEQQLQQKDAELGTQKARIDELRRQKVDKSIACLDLKELLRSKDVELETTHRAFQRQLQQKDAELETCKDLKRQIRQKDVELDACKGLKLQLQQKQVELDACKGLKVQLQQKQAELDACNDLKRQLHQKDTDLQACRAKLEKEQDKTKRVMSIYMGD
jgi:hypothetical protein